MPYTNRDTHTCIYADVFVYMQTVRRSQHKLTFLCAAAMDERFQGPESAATTTTTAAATAASTTTATTTTRTP